MDVPLLDLKPQYRALKDSIDEAMARVVASQHFILGAEVEAFEKEMAEYLGVPHAVGCASGTDAILLPLKALEPRHGDEVVVPAFTFFATAGAVWNAGFTPVFCDIDPKTFNMSVETVDAAWSPRTRAVVPVHLFGQMAPMDEICTLARERGAVVIEDAAQAIGARQKDPSGEDEGRWAGAVGDGGAFSFFPTKNLGGFGDGGLVSATDGELAERVAKLRVHGGRQMYHHEMVGTNSRLDALQAAVLRTKLPHLDAWTRARRDNARRYNEVLGEVDGVRIPDTLPGNHHVYNQYTLRVETRDRLREHLTGKGIGTGVYYPTPLHLQPCFAEVGRGVGSFPHAEAACREVLSLPVFPELGRARQERVASEIRSYFGA